MATNRITSIKRLSDAEYFVTTNTFLADLTYLADTVHFTGPTTLRSVPGFRVGFPMTVTLSAARAAALHALAVGDTLTVEAV